MSRLAQRNGASSAAAGALSGKANGANPTRSGDAPLNADEICPVCKSTPYMNPQMRFLINPVCYHKMCSSCVDRVFSQGPAPCPVIKCGKVLRKHRFRKQTFEDSKTEREVDIRKRVAEVFNRREEEFVTLRDWNDYLEEVENVTFELVEGIDVEKNERKMEQYQKENVQSIKSNASIAKDENASAHAREAAEREAMRLRRAEARREEEEQRTETEESRRRTVDELARGKSGDAQKIAKDGENRLKSSLLRRSETQARQQQQDQKRAMSGNDTFVIRGLKKRPDPEDLTEKPYDPFGGIHFKMEYYVPLERYDFEWLEKARNDLVYAAGGYDVHAYEQRALCEAFSGLGVFIGDEMSAKDNSLAAKAAAAVAPSSAHVHKKVKKEHKIEDDDVF